MRQISLDTETTGLKTTDGHRIIEVGCLELNNRRLTDRQYHQYINPQRDIDAGAVAVHGITAEFLVAKPLFSEVIVEFLAFIKDAQLIIHNASFDIGFLDYELNRAGKKYGKMADYCTVIDTLALARQLHPGQRNSLDALCKRYGISNTHRTLHGALVDAELLALVYLAMTGGQTSLFAEENNEPSELAPQDISFPPRSGDHPPLRIIKATADELNAHEARLAAIDKTAKRKNLWREES